MVGRDDNEVLNLYRGECKFAAQHMSLNGTSRTSGDVRLESAKWTKADIDQVAVTRDFYEYTSFCNGPVDVKCSPIVTPPSSRFCPWSTLRPPHYAVRGSGEPI